MTIFLLLLFIVLLVAGSLWAYREVRHSAQDGRPRSRLLFWIGLASTMAVSPCLGFAVGVVIACSPANAANLCGMFGFLTAPLAFLASVPAYLILWARRGRRAPG